ncbi:hypothetical protein OAC89_05890 [Deltaproteobacteria bacterium]|nr:hypothetical protein [Deltaproteobacteria bacterium]
MLKKGTAIEMTKGYKGMKGVIVEATDSPYEFYLVYLDNGINIVVGPSAFILDQSVGHNGII